MTDLSKIVLVWPEKWRLFVMRFKKRTNEKFLKEYANHLYRIDFICKNYLSEVDEFNAPIYDGTYSLTITYYRYCAKRRDDFFNGSIWPAVISAIVSVIVSTIMNCYFK